MTIEEMEKEVWGLLRSLKKSGQHHREWGEILTRGGVQQIKTVAEIEALLVQIKANGGATSPSPDPDPPIPPTDPGFPNVQPTETLDLSGTWKNLELRTDDVLENTHYIQGRNQPGIITPSHTEQEAAKRGYRRTEPITGVRIKNCIIEGDGTTYWGYRGYDLDGVVVEDTLWRRLGDYSPNTGKDEGHAIYLNLFGGLIVRDSHFEKMMGQAVQLVWFKRTDETNLDDTIRPARTIELQEVSCLDCGIDLEGKPSGEQVDRGSFPISFKGVGQTVSLVGVSVRTSDEFPGWWNHRTLKECKSRGGLLVGIEGHADGPTEFLGMRGVELDLVASDREAVQFERIKEVDWVGGLVQDREGQAVINIRGGCPKGLISDVDGNFVVKRNGVEVAQGPLTGGKVFEWNTSAT